MASESNAARIRRRRHLQQRSWGHRAKTRRIDAGIMKISARESEITVITVAGAVIIIIIDNDNAIIIIVIAAAVVIIMTSNDVIIMTVVAAAASIARQ